MHSVQNGTGLNLSCGRIEQQGDAGAPPPQLYERLPDGVLESINVFGVPEAVKRCRDQTTRNVRLYVKLAMTL